MNVTATFRFYEELNDLLSVEKRKRPFSQRFAQGATVKDIIESMGIPHTEVDLILVNGKSVDFSYQVQNNDYVSVYPMFEALDISPILRLRPEPLRITRFITDVHLGKVTKLIRLLGFDTYYAKYLTDQEIIAESKLQSRIILTRDLQLLKHRNVTHGYFIRNIEPTQQIMEVIQRFDLRNKSKPFTRCLECNGCIEKIADINLVKQSVPPAVLAKHADFFHCTSCYRVYWPGTHFEKLSAFVQKLLGSD